MNDEDDKRETQVPAQIKELEDSIGRLITDIDRLQDHMGKILRDPTPDVAGDKEEEEVLVPMANTIRVNHRFITKICNQVEDIINRLEL